MKVTEEMIRIKAYELWEADGKPPGTAEEHWFAAKALLQNTDEAPLKAKPLSPPNGLRQLGSN